MLLAVCLQHIHLGYLPPQLLASGTVGCENVPQSFGHWHSGKNMVTSWIDLPVEVCLRSLDGVQMAFMVSSTGGPLW